MGAYLSAAAVISAVTFLVYFTARSGTARPPVPLAAVLLLTAALEIFDQGALFSAAEFAIWKKYSLVTEALIIPAWLWFALSYVRKDGIRSIGRFHRWLLAVSPAFALSALIFPLDTFMYSPDFVSEKTVFLTNSGLLFYVLAMGYLVTALVQLEHTLVRTTWVSRWKIKLELLGSGSLIAILIIYFSHGLLFRTIDMQLVPMKNVVQTGAIALMFISRLKYGGCAGIRFSPQMACRSAVLLAVGMYIIILGLIGEGVKYFGNSFQHSLIFACAFLAGLILLIILLSESVKRRVTVFIHKNFYQNKFDYRTQWIKFTDRLSASHSGETLLQAIVSEFCETFGMGSGILFLLDQQSNSYRPAASLAVNRDDIIIDSNDPVIELMSGSKWITDLRDNIIPSENPGFRTLAEETDACFVIPLYQGPAVEGFVVIGHPRSSDENYTHEDFDLMRTLAKQATSALLNLKLSEQLACSRELAAIGKVAGFVIHDLKNHIVTLSLLLDNARVHISSPEFQEDLLRSLGNIVDRMNGLILRLKQLPEKESLHMLPVDLLLMAREAAELLSGGRVDVTGEHVIAVADRHELQKVTLNLIVNAVEATRDGAPVNVEVGECGNAFIRVRDDGCGIPEHIRKNGLFKPFSSSKTSGLGIGLYHSRQIVEAHGGSIDVSSAIGRGSEFTVWLPKTQGAAAQS